MPRLSTASSAADAPAAADAVVLEPTRRGREELERSRVGLGSHQRRLLEQIDGRRSLAECAEADISLQRDRLARDAARLVAFGLARQVEGELPRQLMVAAMDLTARVTLHELPPLEPERTVNPMMPRVASSPNRPPPEQEPPPEADGPRWSIALLAALLAAAVALIGYFS